MLRVCAWCKLEMGKVAPLGDKSVTHGICSDCKEEVKADNVVQFPTRVIKPSEFIGGERLNGCPFIDNYDKHMCSCSEVICLYEDANRLVGDILGG